VRGVAVAGGFRQGAGASILTIVAVSPPRGVSVLPPPTCTAATHHDVHSLGALSRGSRPRCLRFAAFLPALAVVRPRKTRFRLVANLCRTGVETPQGPE